MGIGTLGGVTESGVKRILDGLGFDFSDGVEFEQNGFIFSIKSGGITVGQENGPRVESSSGGFHVRVSGSTGITASSGEIQIGTDDTGIIFHTSPGITKRGVPVSTTNWIEIYGQEIHFSEL